MPHESLSVAYSYLRFSELGKQARGDSIRRQTAARDAWLARNPNVRLDTSLRMKDEGVSAYSGGNRTNIKNALAQFLAMVETGDVQPGSYLIVENLDRLTREHPRDSIRWVLDLIAAGIRVVQLAPFEQVYDASMDERSLFFMLTELARGHAESKRKSTLIAPKWAEKKRLAREGVPIGKQVPAWLALAGGKYVVKPGAQAAVRAVFRLCSDGLGNVAIARRLNGEKVHLSPAGEGVWTRGYVARVLASRAVLGEYQPMKGHTGREKDGAVILAYFPAVVDEKLWYAAQHAKALRRNNGGRPSKTGLPTSPFAGLLWHAIDGVKLQVKKTREHTYLVSLHAHEGVNSVPSVAFPLASLVDSLLSQLRELRSADLFSDPAAGQLEALRGQLEETEEKLRVARERFDGDRGSAVWADMVSEYDRAARALRQEIEASRRIAENPASGNWLEAVRLMKRSDPVRLRQCLRATVEGVWCVFVGKGCYRIAAVQVWFTGGAARRDYLILHRSRYGVDAQNNPPLVRVASPAEMLPLAYDLRDQEQARACEAALRTLDLSALEGK